MPTLSQEEIDNLPGSKNKNKDGGMDKNDGKKPKNKKWFWIGGVILFFIIVVAIIPTPENENTVPETTNLNNDSQVDEFVVENINQETESSANEIIEEEMTFVFQEPSEFQQDSPENTLAEYIKAWKNQDWNNMVNYVQLTWKDSMNDPVGDLESWYSWKTPLKGFEIISVTETSDVTSDIVFTVQYEAVEGQITKKQITARIIKETGPLTPSVQGQWGVNPSSTYNEKNVD